MVCHLVFLPCAVLFLWACSVRCFPCCRFTGGFQVTGCLSCFPGDMGWASALPFLFLCLSCSACLQEWPGLYTLCLGAPVTVMSPWFGVGSPCYPSLTFGWCASGLRFLRRSWFVTTLGSWTHILPSGCRCRFQLV